MRSAPLTHLLDGDIFYRTVRFIVHRRSGWGHFRPYAGSSAIRCNAPFPAILGIATEPL